MGGSSGKGWQDWLDPIGSWQATKNTIDVLKGDQQFGQHENWFGNSAVGDILNPMMGGNTQADRQLWDDYYVQQAKNDKAWKAAMDDNLQRATGGTSVSTYKEPKEQSNKKSRRDINRTQQGGSLLTDPDAYSWLMEDT